MFALMLAVVLVGSAPQHYTGIVWLHSDGCVPCKQMEPTINKLILEGAPIVIIKVSAAEDIAPYSPADKRVPTTVVYKDGAVVQRVVGVVSEKQLRAWLKTTGGH